MLTIKRPCNDEVTKVFDWLYIGGVKNTRKTLPLVDVWYDFKCDTREPRNLKVDDNLIINHIPFDDGDIKEAIQVWKKCHDEILAHKEKGRKVFVSCYEGVSRSAVLVLWLCCTELGEYETAWGHLKKCRNIYPDKKFYHFIDELKKKYN